MGFPLKKYIQIDCEALCNKPTGVVLSIGACIYDVNGVGESIELFPALAPQVKAGRTIDDDTFLWWFSRPLEMRQSILNGERQPLAVVADEFVEWFHEVRQGVDRENIFFSAYGNDYDLPKVESLLGDYRTMPWEGRPWYKNKVCLRALAVAHSKLIEWPEGPVAHTARADAINQAKAHISLLKKFPDMQ